MFYLVGLRTHDGYDWVYEVLEIGNCGTVIKAIPAHGNKYDWHQNLHNIYGDRVGNHLIDIIENLDFVSLKKKKREKVLGIIDKHNQFYRKPAYDKSEYWVFKIPNNQICKSRRYARYVKNSI